MTWLGVLLLLAIAIGIKYIGGKLVPAVTPKSWIKAVGVGLIGGFLGSLLSNAFFPIGPRVWDVNLLGAVVGAVFFVFLLGIYPFIKILFGRV